MIREYLAKRKYVNDLLKNTVARKVHGKIIVGPAADVEVLSRIANEAVTRNPDAGGYFNNFDPRNFSEDERRIKPKLPLRETSADRLAKTKASHKI